MGTTEPAAEAYRLYVLGQRDLLGLEGDRVSSVLAQPKRLCLLTYLALAAGPVSRSTLAALFWPESDETRARNALNQALHYLRRSLGDDVVKSLDGDLVVVPGERLWCDAAAVLRGGPIEDGRVEIPDPDLLEGWIADDSQPLQEWLDTTRREVRERAEELAAEGTRPTEPEAPSPHRNPLARLPAMATVAVAAVAVLILVAIARPSPPVDVTASQTVMVLLPRVTAGAAPAASIPPELIHDELVAQLHELSGTRVVAAPYFEEPDDWRRQLAALGDLGETPWVLEVSAVLVGDQARVLAFLRRGPGVEVIETERLDLVLRDDGTALLEVPSEIAREVSRMVDSVVAEAGGEARSEDRVDERRQSRALREHE